MPPQPVVATLIRKGEVTSNVTATIEASKDGYVLTGLPGGLLDGGELLAVVVGRPLGSMVANEAGGSPLGSMPEDTKD